MNIIKLRDININKLKKLNNQGTKSIIYTDGEICYKILNGFYQDEKEELYIKFQEMDGINIENVLMPKSLIIDGNKLCGYTMNYFENSVTLNDKFWTGIFDCNELFNYVYKASKTLKNIHMNGIIYQDLSFDNILVDFKGNIVFCDIDGCSYKGQHSPFFSLLFKRFLIDYKREKLVVNENVDKISMILSFYMILYGKVLEQLTIKQYHYLSNNINTLEKLRNIANILVDKDCPIIEVPYLDEIIDLKDSYLIDREKIIKYEK